MKLLEDITQELESGVRLVSLESPIYINYKAVFVADVITPSTQGHRRDRVPAQLRRINDIATSLRTTGLHLSTISPSKFDLPLDKNTSKKLSDAEIIFTLPDYVNKIMKQYPNANIVLLVDEAEPSYAKFPQALIPLLPISAKKRKKLERISLFREENGEENEMQKSGSPVLDRKSFRALFFYKSQERERKSASYFPPTRDEQSGIEKIFLPYLGKGSFATLEQILSSPLTSPSQINSRLSVIDYFIAEKRATYSEELSRKLSIINKLSGPLRKLTQSVSIMLQCHRGDLGWDLSKMYKSQGLGFALPYKIDTKSHLILGIKEQYYHKFMEALDSICEVNSDRLFNFSMPEINSVDIKRMKKGFEILLNPENKYGFRSMINYLKSIKEKNPKNAEELLGLLDYKDTISKYNLGLNFVAYVSAWLGMYSGLAAFFRNNNWTRPEIMPKEEKAIKIDNGWNPFLSGKNIVRNSTYINENSLVEIVEGANQGGKSVYLLQVPIILTFAQSGLYVPAEAAKLSVHERIFVRLKRTGSILDNQSAFRDEIDETLNLFGQLKGRERYSAVFLDEWLTSTRPDNGDALMWGLINSYFALNGVRAIITTHLPNLGEVAEQNSSVRISYFPCEIKDGKVQYSYKKVVGFSQKQIDYGIRIAEALGLPSNIIESAKKRFSSS